jgi:CheY-like chemotaxis protein
MGRVLIVDDHEDIRRAVGRVVSASGHEPAGVGEGDVAITTATESPPGLIIIDIMMPGVTGFEVLRALRSDPRTREVPIVVYSALNEPEFIELALSLGANDYWVKGAFDLETLGQWLTYYVTEGKR